MTRDADIPTIFNPGGGGGGGGGGVGSGISVVSGGPVTPTGGGRGVGRVRTPSVVVTGNEQQQSNNCRNVTNGPFTTPSTPQMHHTDSVTSQVSHDAETPTGGSGGQGGGTGTGSGGGDRPTHKLKSCTNSCCSKSARKIYFGVCVTVCVTASWVGATHCIKYLYLRRPTTATAHMIPGGGSVINPYTIPVQAVTSSTSLHHSAPPYGGNGAALPAIVPRHAYTPTYNAPFFTTWFCTNWTILFFPLFFLCRLAANRCKSPGDILGDCIRNFRDRGFTIGRFLTRCSLFCLLWVGTNYMYINSLRILLATDVMALFATNVACVYLLSWVILHEQFVGVRIVAVILCDTGIALLAYMDGITGSPTLGGVVLAACAAAGSAVYKVLFKKVIGEATYGQVALFFSIIGLLNAALLWPVSLTLYFTGVETLYWDMLPWPALLGASTLSLVANLLGNFSVAVTYDLFITLGLITAVPVSAALDVVLYGAHFAGMKLAGMILIAVGFFLVMFPDNWPDYITRLLRNIIMLSHSARWSRRHRHGAAGGTGRRDVIDYRTGYIRSHLRSPSGRVR